MENGNRYCILPSEKILSNCLPNVNTKTNTLLFIVYLIKALIDNINERLFQNVVFRALATNLLQKAVQAGQKFHHWKR